ncbi:MAG TPA: HDOD domain-containing protein [Syntrophales bacterium]|nr:HDOD domain-containing protein [Syntrophales bacterium]
MTNENEANVHSGHGTVEFLLRRMRHKGDLPAFSKHVVEINSKLSSLKAITLSNTGDLAKIILKDFSLTNKLLKIVNSAVYGNLAGRVTTVSKAVMLLGFEKVRMIATALMIFEHLQNKSQAAELKEVAMESFLSGVIAMDLAEKMKVGRVEEAFICAMLRHLGKLLVICYFPEEYEAIKEEMRDKELGEDSATRAVLGISFNELGMAVSRSWNFPDMLVRSMENPPPGVIEPAMTELERMRYLTHYAHDLCSVIAASQGDEWGAALAEMSVRYQKVIPLPEQEVEVLLDSAAGKIDSFSGIVNLDRSSSPLLSKLSERRKDETGEPDARTPDGRQPMKDAAARGTKTVDKSAAVIAQEKKRIVTSGISEIADVMKGSYNLSDVIYMILETMYRGFAFNRVIFCLRDVSGKKMVGRFGLGDRSEDMVALFQIQIGQASDIFNIAISQGRGMIIADAGAPTIVQNLPQWYRASVAAPAFLVYPLVIKGTCLGLFYADKSESGTLLTESQCMQMEDLRDMAVEVITQKHL